MPRWPTDSRARLQAAAIELYLEQGYDQSTVAAIVQRAGLTERTFYRHFGDKREVLFAGESELTKALVAAVEAAGEEANTRERARAGLAAIVDALEPRREELARRQPIIEAHPELRERELMKLDGWTAALAEALRRSGDDPATAAITAEVSIAVLRVAALRWLVADHGPLADELAAAFIELPAIAG
ncbi:MAG: helix-turn-helix domain-containing protein [Solirubrobacteraceae bacterium]|nr:helix-turn-helix domain-containing protein [Solirubrobacteraceae bacterium]